MRPRVFKTHLESTGTGLTIPHTVTGTKWWKPQRRTTGVDGTVEVLFGERECRNRVQDGDSLGLGYPNNGEKTIYDT